jgi:hypothetical protein
VYIVLDYYENAGGNVLGFSLTPLMAQEILFLVHPTSLCARTERLTGSNLISCNANTNTAYQWQSSTDNESFSNISGASLITKHNVPAVAATRCC